MRRPALRARPKAFQLIKRCSKNICTHFLFRESNKRQQCEQRGPTMARFTGLALAFCLAVLAFLVPCVNGVERASWHDARRTVRGPFPSDAGDASSRRARALAEDTRDEPGTPRKTSQKKTHKPEPAHGGWGARRGHHTPGGSGRDGLGRARHLDDGSTENTSRRRKLLFSDESNAAAEAANASNLLWPSLDEVPTGLRCSGCELTLAAVHASAVTAARRLNPPSWVTAGENTKQRLVEQNWNAACAFVAADVYLKESEGKFTAGDGFVTRIWEQATQGVIIGNSSSGDTTGTNTTTGTTTPISNSSIPSTTLACSALSVCALLRRDARSKLQITGVVVNGNVYPFDESYVTEQCFVITGDETCQEKKETNSKEEL